MNVKLVLAAVLVACAALALLWRAVSEAGPPAIDAGGGRVVESGEERAAEPRAEEAARLAGEPALEEPEAVRSESRTAAASAPEEELLPDAPVVVRRIQGRVLDVEALPLAGVEVVFRADQGGEEVFARSGAGGTFELETPPVDGRVRASSKQYVTVLGGVVKAHTEVEPLVVVAGRRALGGQVVDVHGEPLEDVNLHYAPPPGFEARFEAVLDSTSTGEWRARSDADGRFAWFDLPVMDGAVVEATLDGFVPAAVAPPPGDVPDLLVTLERPEDEAAALTGVVLDPDGLPVPGAHVSLGALSSVTDGAGEFVLPRTNAETAFELVAVRRGHRPGRVRAMEDPATGEPLWPESIVLHLGGPPLALAGQVVDQTGEPRANVQIWIEDPTPFGVVDEEMVAPVEFLLAAGEDQEPNWVAVHTDGDGRFRIEGLLERGYTLRMLDDSTLDAASVGPFAAGTEDARVVFPLAPLARIAGRVVSSSGAPVEGVSLKLLRNAYGGIWSDFAGGSAVTDPEGRFAFDDVTGQALLLWIRGDDVLPKMHTVADAAEADDLEIVVTVRCHLKVDLSGVPHEADRLRVLDADGAQVDLLEVGATGVTTRSSAPIVGGRSVTLGVADTARTLILEKDGQEVRRVALNLVPGQLNVVR